MAKYTLIASRDPFGSHDTERYLDLARDLRAAGNDVTLFLVQNAVLGARKCAFSAHLSRLAQHGVSVLADEFSLRERAVRPDQLTPGVEPAPLDVIVDHLAEGRKVIWH